MNNVPYSRKSSIVVDPNPTNKNETIIHYYDGYAVEARDVLMYRIIVKEKADFRLIFENEKRTISLDRKKLTEMMRQDLRRIDINMTYFENLFAYVLFTLDLINQ